MEPCPFCGSTSRREHGGRPQAGCAGCGSLERHRALVRRLATEFEPRSSGRCVELAPRSPEVYGGYLRRRGWDYRGVDRWDLRSGEEAEAFGYFIDHDADATDLAFAPSGGFELFITQHVVEQVLDYPAVLDEAARVLELGGRALLEIPWDPHRPESVRKSRDRHGSVWSFGEDLAAQLAARFASVEYFPLSEDGYRGGIFVCRKTAPEPSGASARGGQAALERELPASSSA